MKVSKKSYIFGTVASIIGIMLVVLAVVGIISKNGVRNSTELALNYDNQEQQDLKAGESKSSVTNLGTKEEIVDLFVKKYKETIKYKAANRYNSLDIWYENEIIAETAAVNDNAKPSEDKTDSSYNETEVDYYKNNNQVEGVIEGDFVLTDGKYIYSAYNNCINIVETSGAELRKVSVIDIAKDINTNNTINIETMYVKDEKMFVVITIYDSANGIWIDDRIYESVPCSCETMVVQYDISHIEKPECIKNIQLEGMYNTSRFVGDYLYLITSRNCILGNYEDYEKEIEETCIPKVDGEAVSLDKVYGCNSVDNVDNYAVITSINCSEKIEVSDKCAVMMNGGETYVSKNNIYILQNYYEDSDNEDNSKDYGKTMEVNHSLIYKFQYMDGEIEAVATAKVEGDVLNQFSMDEFNGYFRIVSTVVCMEYDITKEGEKIWDGENIYQSVYIMDDNLNIVGNIEGIAENETVRSVRFMDDRVYFVTFRNTDPLFVVDLSIPESPVILDELKVTGFSEYLHDWGDGLLLGIGEEVDPQTGITIGAKLSMFDTENDELEEISREVLYDANEICLYDYKSIMIDADKNLIGFTVLNEDCVYEYYVYEYKNHEFNELFSYSDEESYNTYRGVYIGNYLYIVSENTGIQAVCLDDFSYGDYCEF